jgi:hypothetical protein
MNIVKIYKGEDEIPTFIIEAEDVIDATKYVTFWNCKEEVYVDEKLIETKYHKI